MKQNSYVVLFVVAIILTMVTVVPLSATNVSPVVPIDRTGLEDIQEEKVLHFLPAIMSPAMISGDPFTLIAPADGAQLDTLIPIIKFVPENLPENAGGCMVIDELPDQTGCNLSFGPDYDMWEFVLWFNLMPDTQYYWRVGAVIDYDYDNIEWGTQWSFTTGPTGGPIPSAPILVAPADGATVSADNLTLQWQAVDDAAEYKLSVTDKISGNGYGASDIFPPATQAGPNEIGWIFDFAKGPDFEWTVAARNDYAWGVYTTPWSFTIISDQDGDYGIDLGKDIKITGSDGSEIIKR